MPEFHQRVGVLQQLGYVSPDGTVTLKGRAACEINSTQVGGRGRFFWGAEGRGDSFVPSRLWWCAGGVLCGVRLVNKECL